MEKKKFLTFIETKFEEGTPAMQVKKIVKKIFVVYLDSLCIRLTIKLAMNLLNKSSKLKRNGCSN
ncbi:MAG: hypothetical protein L6V81_01410 [Clostridium sp.]|nr:MAG: hypothetical protein L6V81_01410 [Clostridium sp.]